MKIRRIHVLLVILALAIGLIPFRGKLRTAFLGGVRVIKGKKTVSDRLAQFGDSVRVRLEKRFQKIGIAYPPRKMTLVGLKHERVLEVWVSNDEGEFRHLKSYPILGASGELGPKLAEGDRQVPEGFYRIESLNPNSAFYVALRLDYPNRFDQAKGKLDGRTDLGSDIMIHGKTASIGCLAMGDEAAEELFTLAAKTGLEHISVILSPVDFRVRDLPSAMPSTPAWTRDLYTEIKAELGKYRLSQTIERQ